MYRIEKLWRHKSNICVVIILDVGHRISECESLSSQLEELL